MSESRAAGAPDLLLLALSRPTEAVTRAREVLAADPEPLAASIARQAIGIVLRETGDADAAVHELRVARRLARRSGSVDRETDVMATLGLALVFAGHTGAGRAALDEAVDRSTGLLRGRTLLRRGGALQVLGLHQLAQADLSDAIAALRVADDQIWEARALTARAFTYLASGASRRAAADLTRAEELFGGNGQELESADAAVHRGVLARLSGDIPAALTCFDDAEVRFDLLGTSDPSLSMERCAALLAAGLPDDALAEADSAIKRLRDTRGQRTKEAELLLTGATSALAAGQPEKAMEHAADAARLFGRQGRRWWRAHARLAQVSATFAAYTPDAALLRAAQHTVRELAELGSPDLAGAQLVTGRIALALGRVRQGRALLAEAARSRRTGPALARVVGWEAEAFRADAEGEHARLLHACRRGLATIDEHRSALGSSELRANASRHGVTLAAFGLRHALRRGGARAVLEWSERWRAGALAVPPVRPADDARLQAELTALRDVTVRLATARATAMPTTTLRREQLRLERAVRGRARSARGAARTGGGPLDVGELLDALGDGRLVEIVDVDGELHLLVCGGGRVRRHAVGPTERVASEVEFARFGLSRLARGMPGGRAEQAYAQLLRGAGRLEEALLGAAGGLLGDGDVVVVPPGRLHAIPWGLLPGLADRVLSVAPSASTWLRARRAPADGGRVVLVNGPGLPYAAEEVAQVAAVHGEGVAVLGGGTARVRDVLAALDGARLAHVAAHGLFRTDSPLFSALRLDDGPMTAYDLEGLSRAPERIVLSSCDSGLSVAAAADELLGLVSALIPLGTKGLVASVVPVNDRAAAPLMVALHRRLKAGDRLADALRHARHAIEPDPVAMACGQSFIAYGAA